MHQERVDNVHVFARFRPFNQREKGMGGVDESEDVYHITDTSVKINHPAHPQLEFVLNRVFDPSSTQQQVYACFGDDTIR